MKITAIDCHVLVAPGYDARACSSIQDDLVVEVHTDEGITGVGETDTNPWVAQACVKAPGTHIMGMGLEELAVGADPLQPEALWQRLYAATKMTGRRGAMICALGAVDMALWDIKGKALGLPVHQLLGGAGDATATPYASLLPTGDTLPDYQASLVAKLERAVSLGYAAAKLEVCISGPYSHNGLQEPPEAVGDVVAACREAVGPDFVLMVDVAYAWPDARSALRILERLEPYDLFFVETPLDIDDLDGYAYLHERSPIRIAAGEWQNSHFEMIDLLDRGRVDVVQPDVGRVGGFSEVRRVADLAADRHRLMIPHCWKSGIGVTASLHVAAAFSCPYVEVPPAELADSPLRGGLVRGEPTVSRGRIELSQEPGLGVELDRAALCRYQAP